MARNKDQSSDQDAYQKAMAQWDQRIGDARTQLRNWRMATLLSLLVIIVLLISIIVVANLQKQYVYIAQVAPGQTITNMQPLRQNYTPSDAQKSYFISQFVHDIASLPLDPVVLRQRWLRAYQVSEGRAIDKLTAFARDERPFDQIGALTKSVKIQNFHPVSPNSYEFTWVQTTYDEHGKVTATKLYNGLFTLRQGALPTTSQGLLNNPLGLKVSYFNIKQEG